MQWSTGACYCAVLLLQLQGPVVDASLLDTLITDCFPSDPLESQERYFNDLKTMVDGDIEGGMHIVPDVIIRVATGNTGAKIDGILGGPVGAVVGGPTTDMMITNIDTASADANRNEMEIKPYGKYLMNIGKRSVGDHIDAMATVAPEAAGGGGVSNSGKATKPQYETLQKRVKTTARKELVDYLYRLQADNVKKMNYIQLATVQQLVESYEREKSDGAHYD